MLKNCGVLLLCLNCVLSTPQVLSGVNGGVSYYNRRFSLWPSVLNGAKLMRVRREGSIVLGPSEGGDIGPKPSTAPRPSSSQPVPAAKVEDPEHTITEDKTVVKPIESSSTQAPANSSQHPATSNSMTNSTTIAPVLSNGTNTLNVTTTEKAKQLDLNNPGVVKRGLIVFGGFALMAVAYFIFYRKKSKNSDTGNSHGSIDANQFRYGVLQSEDGRDNFEPSRVPLTMESDDDEDEDLEIFDLEQKKKSLSYVNLQTNDEDMVFSKEDSPSNDRDNLLLDIEDATSETLINWSSNGNNKSIL